MISVLALGSSEPLRPLQNNVPGSSSSFPSSEHAQQRLVKVLVGARDQRNTSKSHSEESRREKTVSSMEAVLPP